ncbi:hypothetical protein E1A91_A05G403200v1 [Gossypium mustelinum]|uniref:Deoxyribonuclease TATDN1 isoform X2 n=2 Tax=Gossypium TaxID=3633 RepID=A0ABM3BT95_GOSHI|nr:putative deoxyribonuclease TATDN1 isoform X2 [Gossypium hirsutum]TYJ37837.1 hypothetical protein E1A91_A05G403200v1 [Gossypium mustelinum]
MGLRNIFTGIRFNFSVPKYTDIAVNFTDGMFKGIYNGKQHHVSDIATVLSRAWNVDRIIVTGGSLEESKEALAIAETDGRLFCTVGVHPTRCKVVAIGECGLDYDRLHFCPPEVQKKYFEKQFELAYATKLPMFLHMRAAAEDFCEIMERNINKFTGGVTHSFTGSAEDRDKLLSFHNMYIGVNGCSLKMAENLDVVRGIPVERMMIETDSPYCEIKSTHAGINFVKSLWPSKKKEKYDKECLVKGRNEPCLVLVKATIERYKKASDSSNTGSVAEVNAQFYQQEAEKLRNQIRNLQNTNRHMLGESVGGLPMKELKSLESRLEKGISRIRSKKNELLFAEIEYMQKKVKIVKCTVNDIPVDISFNQTAGLSALCFLEKV